MSLQPMASFIEEIKNNIDRTLRCRQEFAKRPEEKIRALTLLEEKLKAFKVGALRQYSVNLEESARLTITSLEQELDTFINDGRISDVRKKLNEILIRFQRNSLCVAIVGNKGQGKSKFLQGVTGLGDEIIPTGTGKDTTGAQMIFINDASVTDVKALLHFYQENEFLIRVIQPLFSAISLAEPSTLSEFVSFPKSQLEEKKEKNPELVSTIERLQNDYPAYKEYLKGGTKEIQRTEIRDWTAKHNVADHPLTKWMAVKLAEIYCPFPRLEGVKISVADTPGLGDSYVPKEGEKLRENFTAKVDHVCIFRRVRERGLGSQDDNLYRIVDEAIGELEVSQWTHFLVNIFESEKKDSVIMGMLETLQKCFDDPSSRFSKLKNRYHEISVCTGEPPVLNEVAVIELFAKIVADMAKSQAELDKTIFEERFKQVALLIADIEFFLQKIRRLTPKDDVALPFTELDKLFRPCFTAVEHQLRELVNEKRAIRDESDAELETLIDEAETNAIQGAEAILAAIKETEIGDVGIFTLDTYHQLRVALSTAFDNLDLNLEANLKGIRRNVVDILRNHGQLGQLFQDQELSPDEYLEKLAQQWEEIEGGSKICEAIRQFVKMTFSFRAYLLPKVRGTLDGIDYDSGKAPAVSSGSSWADNRVKIQDAFNRATKDCAFGLKTLTSEKNKAVFALIDQLRDGLLRTGGYLQCQNLWRAFYHENRDAIWIEKGLKAKNNRQIKRDWESELDAVQEIVHQLRVLESTK